MCEREVGVDLVLLLCFAIFITGALNALLKIAIYDMLEPVEVVETVECNCLAN